MPRSMHPTHTQADADALADCPNFWVPRKMVEGAAPALTAAEQVVQALYARLVGRQLQPWGAGGWRGAEYWCQVRAREAPACLPACLLA